MLAELINDWLMDSVSQKVDGSVCSLCSYHEH